MLTFKHNAEILLNNFFGVCEILTWAICSQWQWWTLQTEAFEKGWTNILALKNLEWWLGTRVLK